MPSVASTTSTAYSNLARPFSVAEFTDRTKREGRPGNHQHLHVAGKSVGYEHAVEDHAVDPINDYQYEDCHQKSDGDPGQRSRVLAGL